MASPASTRRFPVVDGGHRGQSVADCSDCWNIAYEPGWYAVLRAGDGLIQVPAEDGGEVVVRLPESDLIRNRNRSDTHTPIAVRRERGPTGPGNGSGPA
jgi:hypothetical protein